VADTGHGAKAEIHPTEVFWWNLNPAIGKRDAFAADGPFDLFVVQDASARYNKEHQYWVETEFPEERVWRPWAQAPVTASFEIPFWSDERPPCFSIRRFEPLLPGAKTPPPPDCRPRDRGAPVAKKGPDPPAVTVDGPLDRRDKLEVKAEWICRCTGDSCNDEKKDKNGEEKKEEKKAGDPKPPTGYLGRLLITAKVGVDRDFEEGALALRVTDERQPLAPAVAAGRAAEMKARPL